MKKRIYILVALLCISFCFTNSPKKSTNGRVLQISFNNSKTDLKRNAFVYSGIALRASKVNLPFRKRRGKGLKGSPILLSAVSSLKPAHPINKIVSFTSQYYYFYLFDANGKRGPPSLFSIA